MSASDRLTLSLPLGPRLQRADHLNLATALLRSGFAPFLALFLHARGLGAGSIGLVMAFSSLVSLMATIPGGALVDRPRERPIWLAVAGLLALAAPLTLVHARGMPMLLCAVAMMALSEAVVAPAVLLMNLDSTGPDGLLDRLGRNQAIGHAGRVVGLSLSGFVGSQFGFSALILFEGLYLLLLLPLVWQVRPAPIAPFRSPAGLDPDITVIVLGITLGLFQVGNSALPMLLGLSLADAGVNVPALASCTAMIPQVAMVLGSFIVVPALRRWGAWRVLAASFATLPLRCLLAAFLPAQITLLPVEILHGLGESAQLLAIGSTIGDLHRLRGRGGFRYGCVMMLQGLGCVASPLLAGYMAERWNASAAYGLLGMFGLAAFAFWSLTLQARRPLAAI